MPLEEATFEDLFGSRKWKKLKVSDLKKHPELADEFFDLISNAYAKIGGHAKIKSPQSLIGGEAQIIAAIDIDQDPHADAVSLAKKKGAGIKSVGMGHDGSRQAKDAVLKYKANQLKSGKQYAEMSGALAHIMITRYGIESVNDKETVEKVLGKKVNWIGAHPQGKYPDNPGWYSRNIGGDRHMKILLGLPARSRKRKREEIGESAAGRSHAKSSMVFPHGQWKRGVHDRMDSSRSRGRKSGREQPFLTPGTGKREFVAPDEMPERRYVSLSTLFEIRQSSFHGGFGFTSPPMSMRGASTSPSASQSPSGRQRLRAHMPPGKARVVHRDPMAPSRRK